MSDKIPTAEESIKNYVRSSDGYSTNVVIDIEDAIEFAKEFAQLHVEAALKAASKNVKLIKDLGENEKGKFISKKLKSYNDEEGYPIYPDKESILNAYPKTLIK